MTGKFYFMKIIEQGLEGCRKLFELMILIVSIDGKG